MKQHAIVFLASLPEDQLAKILNSAMFNLQKLPDRSPMETKALEAAKTAYIRLDNSWKF